MAKPTFDLTKLSGTELEKTAYILGEIQKLSLQKALPSANPSWLYGYAMEDRPGVFSEYVEDVISDLAVGDDPISAFIPAEPTDYLYENTAHLSFIVPEGYDGSTTYMAHLLGQDDVGECDFGYGADYSQYEYQTRLWRQTFSNKEHPISRLVGMSLHKRDTRKFLRGARAGLTIDNDAEWVLGMLTELMESHNRWDIIWGNPYASATSNKNMTEGLDLLLTEGYVANHLVGQTAPVFSDPIVRNFIAVTDPVIQLRMLIAYVGKIIQRMIDRGHRPRPGDIGLFMTSNHWRVYSEILAAGALTKLYTSGDLTVTARDVASELTRIRNSGGIDVLGVFVPVYISNNLGRNMELADGSGFGTAGDVYFLTRYYRGMTILKQRWLNWNSTKLATPPEDRSIPLTTSLGGMVRTTYGFTDGAGGVGATDTCWWYGMEWYKGLDCKMFPLQGKFQNLIVPADLENEIESGEMTHEDFYAYNGAKGHQGEALIHGNLEV